MTLQKKKILIHGSLGDFSKELCGNPLASVASCPTLLSPPERINTQFLLVKIF